MEQALVVKTNEFELPKITWNQEEVNKHVAAINNKYKDLVLNDDQIKAAKKDLAAVRKVKKNLNEEKIRIKRVWNENYIEFEDDIKGSMSSLDEAIDNLNVQIKDYIKAQEEAKEAAIKELEEYQTIKDYITIDPKWLKQKPSLKQIKEILTDQKKIIDGWKNSIKMMADSHGLKADPYIEMLKVDSYEIVTQRLISDQKVAKDAVKKHVTESQVNVNTPDLVEEVKPVIIDKDAIVHNIVRRIKGTKEQLTALKEFADKIGVVFEEVN